jgi:hypothetical protein
VYISEMRYVNGHRMGKRSRTSIKKGITDLVLSSSFDCNAVERSIPPFSLTRSFLLDPFDSRVTLQRPGCGVVSYQNVYHFLPTPFRCIHNRTAHSSAFLITLTCITYMMHSKKVAFVHLHFRRQSAFVEHVFILHSRRCI